MPDELQPYKPVLVHYPEGDRIEYITKDTACYYERIDDNLDVIRDMGTKEIIGFQMNGWSLHARQLVK